MDEISATANDGFGGNFFRSCIIPKKILVVEVIRPRNNVLMRKTPGFSGNKRALEFSLSIEDHVPVALGRYYRGVKLRLLVLVFLAALASNWKKKFSLFLEQDYSWPQILSLPEIRSPEISESSLYGYLEFSLDIILVFMGKFLLASSIVIRGMEILRKRFKNPKLSSSSCAKVQSGLQNEALSSSDSGLENSHLLCIDDLQTNELWSQSFEDSTHSCVPLSGVKPLFSLDRDEILGLSIRRKLLLWAYTLLQGRDANISIVVNHCEEKGWKLTSFSMMFCLAGQRLFIHYTRGIVVIYVEANKHDRAGTQLSSIVWVPAPFKVAASISSSEGDSIQ
uniref:Uncharacterized protein n=1 Tax=Salix viminalis TaxID=40686 RepID=A0A6N2L067_SALVM